MSIWVKRNYTTHISKNEIDKLAPFGQQCPCVSQPKGNATSQRCLLLYYGLR